jgi:hypothetical protein
MNAIQRVCVKPGAHVLLESCAPSVTGSWEYPTPTGETVRQALDLGSLRREELLSKFGAVTGATVQEDGCMGVRALWEVDVGIWEFHREPLFFWSGERNRFTRFGHY